MMDIQKELKYMIYFVVRESLIITEKEVLSLFPKIDCQFNDLDKNKVDKVEEIVKEKSLYYPDFGEISYTRHDYQDEIKKLIKAPKLKNTKNFIFIDPYGYKHIRAGDIKNLLSKGNAEILLFLPTQFMYRFDANGTPEALIDFIDELTEYKNWKETDSV